MKQIMDILKEKMEIAFEKAGFNKEYAFIAHSNRPDLCQFQCNGAMALAKKEGKAPFLIADEIVKFLEGDEAFKSVEVVKPGFINIIASDSLWQENVKGMMEEDKFGWSVKENKKVVIDYGGPNVAKPLHVGHLRSAIIGESVKRILRYGGDEVIGDVHLGDWGLQIGLVINELRHRQPDLSYFDDSFQGEYPEEPPFTIADLEEIYPYASAYSKEHEDYLNEAAEVTAKLQDGYKPYIALWEQILKVSIADLKKNYDRLDVHFDLWKKESDVQKYIPDMIEKLKADNIAYESEGALVIDVSQPDDKKEIPPCLIVKSNGATLYATTDLATIVEREELFDPDMIIYLADKRQELHFKQVFRSAKKGDLTKDNTELKFIGFGTMNGKDKKPFKTRDGGVLRLQTLLEDVKNTVLKRLGENREYDEKMTEEIAGAVALAAIKYGDLSNQASKDYVFDMERFASFEGNTGPYILYSIVRIKSILNKYGIANVSALDGASALLEPESATELNLYMALSEFAECMDTAYAEYAPHRICQYIYMLCENFNSFYHENSILSQEDEKRKASYIVLLKLVKEVLEQCIDLLGFYAPERM